ncbi:DUF885 domain-containing protein [Scleromatobacter humisilvae]|uniref:DUF885 domain-containing protein n=1 Tax=Scleromatobacter humisilvae TaxID=2897159 RepID=A0A9X1YNN3_9BURK|nr:DUF885 domain-containing protein [Scleromatobacter humisilvae]MCK9684891.1 DUF885 domain-containing protein [Scleromatobacter humisilvae]
MTLPYRLRIQLAVVALCAAAASHAQPLATPRTPLAPSPGDARRFHATLEATRFRALLDADWQWHMQQFPEWATAVGDHRYDDKLRDASPEAVARIEQHERDHLKALKHVDVDVLSGEDRISYDFALQDAQLAVDWQKYPAMHTRVISAKNGVQLGLPSMMQDFPVRTELDARHALARLKAMPQRIAQDIFWLREGKRLGWVTFKASLSQVPDQIDKLLAKPLTEQPLLAPFTHLPADVPADVRTALQDEAASVLQAQVAPAFLELRKVVVDELLPVSPEDGAMSAYPDGVEVYKLFVRGSTTLPLDAKAVHQIGLDEMARIHAQIDAVMKQVGFTGSYAEFADQLAHDPKYFYTNGDELLAGYRDIAKRIDPQLTKLFVTLPRTPYGIRAIPSYQGANTVEFYSPGAADASTPGWFNANAVALASRPKWAMADTFLHEGVPGHHLQISRAHELLQLPMFRRTALVNAYVEGWALYAESLGDELGLYDDPTLRYGYLRAQAWRAGRLVVDTGIHALGWTRAQAIDYLVDSAGLAREDATAEVDRYVVWPAQALGYKLGELKIRDLRQKAHDALGDRFDLRTFNQEIIDHGALPLPVLERVIDAWVVRAKSAALTAPIADAR